MNYPVIYKFFKDSSKHRKKTNRAVVFNHRFFAIILKYWDHSCDSPTISKTRVLHTHIEKINQFLRKFRFTVLQKHHSNKIWTIDPRGIKVVYLNHPGSCMNVMQSQISSTRKSR